VTRLQEPDRPARRPDQLWNPLGCNVSSITTARCRSAASASASAALTPDELHSRRLRHHLGVELGDGDVHIVRRTTTSPAVTIKARSPRTVTKNLDHLSQINWRRNVANQLSLDTGWLLVSSDD
jgi:hypothetical protein